MQHHSIVGPLKAVRMLLNGDGVLVREQRWNALPRLLKYTRHMDTCASIQTFGASCTCGLIEALMAVYTP